MRLWSVTNFRFLSLVQADSMDQETQTKVTFMCSSYCGTEARFWYWEPKPRSNFGINIETEFFFSKTETFWNFSHFFLPGGHKFWKPWNWTEIFKNNQKILNVWQQVWFKEPFYDSKNTQYYWWLDFPFEMCLRYRLQHRPEVLATLGFSIRPKPK